MIQNAFDSEIGDTVYSPVEIPLRVCALPYT